MRRRWLTDHSNYVLLHSSRCNLSTERTNTKQYDLFVFVASSVRVHWIGRYIVLWVIANVSAICTFVPPLCFWSFSSRRYELFWSSFFLRPSMTNIIIIIIGSQCSVFTISAHCSSSSNAMHNAHFQMAFFPEQKLINKIQIFSESPDELFCFKIDSRCAVVGRMSSRLKADESHQHRWWE